MGNPTVAAPAIPGEKPVGAATAQKEQEQFQSVSVGARLVRIGVLAACVGSLGLLGLVVFAAINKIAGWPKRSFGTKFADLFAAMLVAGAFWFVLFASLSTSSHSYDTSANSKQWDSAVEQNLVLVKQADGMVTQIASRTGAWSQADASDALAVADLFARASSLLKATNAAPGTAPLRQELIDLQSDFEGLYRELGLTVNPSSAYLRIVSQRETELRRKWADLWARY